MAWQANNAGASLRRHDPDFPYRESVNADTDLKSIHFPTFISAIAAAKGSTCRKQN
jgi:hypothetical protein